MVLPDKVRNKFNSGEHSVYSAGDAFNFPDKSIVGSKKLYISNRGRVFAHDSGGFFGDERVKAYSGLIIVTFNSFGSYCNVKLSNESGVGSFTFDVSLSLKEFLNLYKTIPSNKFQIKTNSHNESTPCLITYQPNIGSDNIFYGTFTVHEKEIILNSTASLLKKIPFNRIKKATPNDSKIEISGLFSTQSENINEVSLYIFNNENIIYDLIDKINTSPTVYTYMQNTSDIFGGEIINSNSLKVIIGFGGENIYFINQTTNECVATCLNNETSIYKSEEENIIFEYKNELLFIKPDNEYLINFITQKFKVHENTFINNFGKVNGVIFGNKWSNENVSLLMDRHFFKFFRSELLSKEINIKDCTVYLDANNLIIVYNEEIFLITINSIKKLPKFFEERIEKNSVSKVGYSLDGIPYFIYQDQLELMLYQSNSIICHTFRNEDITDISLTKHAEEHSPFSKIEIKTVNQKNNVELMVPTNIIRDLIYQAYYYSKKRSVDRVHSEQMFLSYSRQINDYILFHFFGQLLAIYEGLKQVQAEEKQKDVRNAKTINNLYYSIQEVKKHFDKVSIYLPTMLQQEDEKIFHLQLQAPYKNLQRNLLGITNQINRSLNEIESSISAVPYSLIKREDYYKIIDERTKRDKTYAHSMLGAGAVSMAGAVVLTGGLAFLATPLLFAGVNSTINSYFKEHDSIAQEEFRELNENHRLDFYIDKIIDSFDHLIHTLLPYLISETNDVIYQTFQQLHKEYVPKLEDPEVKHKLFQKIAQYYTFKQLPIDSSVVMKKGELVELTHQSLDTSNYFIEQFSREVEGNVPKSIETTSAR
ncbi:hypothetical protein BTR23_21295 [Alkalihalophilus pseudofirmus]|nr:hypothetical protein BTR23_21295 [Alkalihalophilus pseudofirmus]